MSLPLAGPPQEQTEEQNVDQERNEDNQFLDNPEGPVDGESDDDEATPTPVVSTIRPIRPVGIECQQTDTTRQQRVQIKKPTWIPSHGQKTIRVNQKEAKKIRKIYPELNNNTMKRGKTGKWTETAQAVTVNAVPGLITTTKPRNNKAGDPQEGLTKLTVVNPTGGILMLPKVLKISTGHRPRFVKQKGKEDSEAKLVLGPSFLRHIVALNTDGVEVRINRLKAEDVGHQALKRAQTAYASWTKSDQMLKEAYPNGELEEE